jgi:hypothetical protein
MLSLCDHDVERSQLQELDLFKSPQLQLQTPEIEKTTNNNNQASPFVVNRRPQERTCQQQYTQFSCA